MKKIKFVMLFVLILSVSLFVLGCATENLLETTEPPVEEIDISESSSDEVIVQEIEKTAEELPKEKETYSLTKTVLLNSGYEMPRIGLGTFTLDNEVTENSVYHAISNGYRLIDTAKYYGNEAAVGNGVRRAIEEGIITREDMFITTKILPNSFSDYSAAIAESNETLGLGYIDLMLIHQKGSGEQNLYKAIEQAVSEGVVRSLGISNYYTKEDYDQITENAKIMPAVVQNENHPYYQNTVLQDYVSAYGTVVESYYPFGGRGHTQDLFGDETIVKIAQAHNKTSPQILVRWHYQAGYIVIPGSSNPEHIAENMNVFSFELSDDEMKQISNINRNIRYEIW